MNSQQLGVGIADTNDDRSAYIVALYVPHGNEY